MKHTHLLRICLFLLGITAVLAACQPETITETVLVEITRVVTETVVEEGETVEVTRVVTETIVETVVETVEGDRESELYGEAADGGEVVAGAAPPLPQGGSKVEEPRESDADDAETTVSEPRAEGAGSDAVPIPTTSGETTAVSTSAEETEISSVDLTLDQNSRLTAGEVDDNAQWDDYLLYLRNYAGASIIEVNVSERHQIWVRDSSENPILGAVVTIEANGQPVTTLRTHSNGRVYFFPRAYAIQADNYTINVTVNGLTETFTITSSSLEREWNITHPGGDQTSFDNKLDILFLIDATGSMADEINQLKENIRAIAAQIDALPAQPDVRFGMVTYRDRGDLYVTQTYDFTPNVAEFADLLAEVRAEGGGDYPEDLNEGLSQAVHNVEWRVDGTVSLIFLVADAPPHLDYGQENHYAVEMRETATRGIKIYPIASSGLDEQGEYVFRQLAQYTGGRFIFLTYGADGPGSTGTETEFEVSDYTVSSLDQLVVRIVEEELAYLVR